MYLYIFYLFILYLYIFIYIKFLALYVETHMKIKVCVSQERYVASLMPLQKSISPWKSPPQLRPFLQQDFMRTLEKAGPQLTSRLKGDWLGLYR